MVKGCLPVHRCGNEQRLRATLYAAISSPDSAVLRQKIHAVHLHLSAAGGIIPIIPGENRMSSEVIFCPSCRHSVRVPESLLGEAVRCPSCKSYFTAPTRDAEGHLGEAQLLADPPTFDSDREDAESERRPSRKARSLKLPAAFLLLIGILGSAVNGYEAYQAISDPELVKRQAVEAQKMIAQMLKIEFKEEDAKQASNLLPIVKIVFFCVSLIPLFGALSMLATRFLPLAFLGSFVAIINPANCICLLGAPVGIYCLIKLFDPDIRSLFRRA
jgi:hypothetical protein